MRACSMSIDSALGFTLAASAITLPWAGDSAPVRNPSATSGRLGSAVEVVSSSFAAPRDEPDSAANCSAALWCAVPCHALASATRRASTMRLAVAMRTIRSSRAYSAATAAPGIRMIDPVLFGSRGCSSATADRQS